MRSWLNSRWPAVVALASGLLLLVWLYPLAYLEMAGKGQGLFCEDLYGRPSIFATQGLQPEQVVSIEHWSRFPPGWVCEFRAYQSDLVVTKEPADSNGGLVILTVALVVIGATWLLIRRGFTRRARSAALQD